MSEAAVKADLEKLINSNKVIIFSKTTCPFCKKVSLDLCGYRYWCIFDAYNCAISDIIITLKGNSGLARLYIMKYTTKF